MKYKSNLQTICKGRSAKMKMVQDCIAFQNDPVTKLVRSFNRMFGGR